MYSWLFLLQWNIKKKHWLQYCGPKRHQRWCQGAITNKHIGSWYSPSTPSSPRDFCFVGLNLFPFSHLLIIRRFHGFYSFLFLNLSITITTDLTESILPAPVSLRVQVRCLTSHLPEVKEGTCGLLKTAARELRNKRVGEAVGVKWRLHMGDGVGGSLNSEGVKFCPPSPQSKASHTRIIRHTEDREERSSCFSFQNWGPCVL